MPCIVTIAIPFYNAEKYLALAIKSVIQQTYNHWELILIDDGSTDHSLAIARTYEAKDKRIRIYSDGKNMNLGHRLNEITKLTHTVYLARMDADDIMHPDRIVTQIKILEQFPEIDVLGTNAYSINEDNNVEGLRIQADLQKPALQDCSSFIHPTIMGKTSWFRNNPYDVKAVRVEDYELWNRAASTSVFKVYTAPLLFYREFGQDYYKKYFKSIASNFYIAKKRNSVKAYIYSTVFLLKAVLYYFFNLAGKEKVLVSKRSIKLNETQLKLAKKVLQQIFHQNN